MKIFIVILNYLINAKHLPSNIVMTVDVSRKPNYFTCIVDNLTIHSASCTGKQIYSDLFYILFI